MPQAIADSEELRRFAQNLKRFNESLQQQIGVLYAQLSNLSATWRDQEHKKFTEEFEQTMIAIKRFVQATDRHIPFLLRKAERIDEYLQQR